jgi:H+/Cl- antiporter ClcA
MMEGAIGFGASTIAILLPGFVAAGVGYIVFVGFGDWGGLHAQAISFTGLPQYTGVHVGDTGLAIVVGVLTALVIVVVRRFAFSVSDGEKRIGMPVLLILGGLAVGLLAQTASWLGADAEEVLFSGQAGVPAVIAEDSAKIVLIVLVAKALAYAVCLGCGFRGGPVFPAIFLGVALATFAVIWLDVSPTLAVAVGTAAGMAAATRMLLTPILFATLLVGPAGVDAVPDAVVAAATAWIVIALLERRRKAHEGSAVAEPAPAAG